MLVKPDARIAEYIAELSAAKAWARSHNTLRLLYIQHGQVQIDNLVDAHWKAQDLMDARGRLTDFVIQRAADTAKRVGFGYAGCPIAPATYANLRSEFRRASHLGEPFPVYSGASSKTIYTSPIGNWAFRFWHDVLHCEMNADFSPAGERKVASQQCRDCSEVFGSDSMEFKLLAADTIGQVQYYTEVGGFVEDQLTYVLDLIESGWIPE